MGAKVILTDKSSALPLIQDNLEQNLSVQQRKNISICDLLWGESIEHLKDVLGSTKLDYIICSDLLYRQYLLQPLMDSCVALCHVYGHPNVRVLVGYENRRICEQEFLDLSSSFF